jgi:hypothetical protein
MAVMIKVDLPNRPEGDAVVVPGLGEFPNGEVSLVREDVLAAYAAANPVHVTEVMWPQGVDVIQLDQDDLQALFSALNAEAKKAESDKAKAEAVDAKASAVVPTQKPKDEGGK